MLTETTPSTSPIKTLNIKKDVLIAAPADIVWDTVLNPPGMMKDMGLKIEPFVGGRWFRDLGNNTGHLWGHVQVIKPPKLLELVGPMAMSYACACHIQYRLTEEGTGTRLAIVHTALGLITPEHLEGFSKGWEGILDAITKAAQEKAKR